MKMWKTYPPYFTNFIMEVEVDRATDSSVWIGSQRHPRNSSLESYFTSRDEAYDYLLRFAEGHVRLAKASLDRAQELLDKVVKARQEGGVK